MVPNRKILVSGASGLLGLEICRSLERGRCSVSRLVRRKPGPDEIQWSPTEELNPAKVSGFDAVIHLAGETIMGLWTDAKKQRIRDSRVLGTQRLARAVAQCDRKPEVFISASAIGCYGNRGDEVLTEASVPGLGFLAKTCQEWEKASEAVSSAGVRLAHIRIGLVLSTQGGALKQMLLPFRLGLGGRIGDGKQWWSWIHIDDVVGAVQHILQNGNLNGAVNLTAPNPVTNREFTRQLGKHLSRPTLFPAPKFALRALLGEMGEEVLLSGQRVMPEKLVSTGYVFQSPGLEQALDRLV